MIEVTLAPVTSVAATLSAPTGSLSLDGSPELEALLMPVFVLSSGGSGASEFVTLIAGATIQARHVVRAAGGVAMPVDTAIASHAQQVAGVSSSAATSGQAVVVKRFGVADEAAWDWQDGVVFCGPTGALTQSPSASGWLLQVARVISPTRIDIDIEQPIAR